MIEALDEDRAPDLPYGGEGQGQDGDIRGLRAATKNEMLNIMSTGNGSQCGLVTRLKLPSVVSDAGVLKRETTNDVERIKSAPEQGVFQCSSRPAVGGAHRGQMVYRQLPHHGG